MSKSCASSAECGPASVGCIPVDTQRVRNIEFYVIARSYRVEITIQREINSVISFQICISCCDLSYCNVESPTNSTNAIFSRKRRTKSKAKRKRPGKNGVECLSRFSSSFLWLVVTTLLYAYHC